MEFLLENPISVGVVGLLLAGLVGWVGLQTSEPRAVWTAGGLLGATALLVAVGVWVETDREQIRRTMREIAEALRANDPPSVYRFLHPNASEGIRHAQAEIPRYTFQEARITSVRDISINSASQPPSAVSEFVAAVKVSAEGSEFYGQPIDVRRLVKVYWMKKDGRWLVRDYEHSEVLSAYPRRP